MFRAKLKDYFKENYFLITLFVIASAIQIIFVFPLMYGDSINYDSSYQYALTQHSLAEIWELLPYDYSPPLYPIMLKLFTMVFGNSLEVMRAFSIFAVVGMMFVATFPVNSVFGKRSAVVALFLSFISPTMLNLIHEIRPTIFAMFFFMAMAVYTVIAYSQDKKYAYICMTVFSVLSMYTHNISLVGAFGIYVFVLILALITKEFVKFKRFLISGVICAVLYIPWLSVILSQISNVDKHFWVSKFDTFDTIRWVFSDGLHRSVAPVTVQLVLQLVFLSVLIRHVRVSNIKGAKRFKDVLTLADEKKYYRDMFLLFAFIVMAMVILFFVNMVLKNLASHRYYHIIGTVWILLLSALFGRFGNKICVAVLMVLYLINYGKSIYNLQNDVRNSNIDEIASEITEFSGEHEISFLHLHEYTLGLMSYYFPDATHYVCDETFTVLGTYDVFPTEIVEIGSAENIWDFTDRCYIFTDEWNFNSEGDTYETGELLESFGNVEITPVNEYKLSYAVASKRMHIAQAVYIG